MSQRIVGSSAVKVGMFAMMRAGVMVHAGEVKNMPTDAEWDTLMLNPGDYEVFSQIAELNHAVLKRREVPRFR